MTPLKLYLLRAAYDWSVDNGFTPHVIADATQPNVQVPVRYVENGRIVLNIHPHAIRDFALDEFGIRFSARFSGVAQTVDIPINAVLALYARENGQGVSFPEEKPAEAASPEGGPDKTPPAGPAPKKGPVLKVVK